MKCLSKKIILFIICGVLTFSVTSTAYYKSVHAMEWVGGALAFEEALKWLLAAIGITATAGMTDAYWDTYGDDFVDYATENGATQTEVAEWQLKACQGIIDKGSIVWVKFKSWAFNLVNGGVGSGIVQGDTLSNVYNNMVSECGLPYTGGYFASGSSYSQNIVNSNPNIYGGLATIRNNYPNLYFFTEPGNYTIVNGYVLKDDARYTGNYVYSFEASGNRLSLRGASGLNTVFSSFTSEKLYLFYLDVISPSLSNYAGIIYNVGGSLADTNFEASTTNVNDLDVISSDGVDEDNPEVTMPMPGVSDSDNEASKDAYQDIIDAINDGTITQEQGVEQIQEILKIVTYDTVTDKVVPPQQNEDGTDKTKDDSLKENKENMGFTLGGLESVFPFCIPFDIYAFMTLLVAEPECPEFDFPIKSVNGQVEEIHVDLAPFEPVAVVVRYCFDFLFIIGLAMLTRSLIGGGSSD